ncbi:MAG: DUF4446 family protein [Nocardioidaceae bacterium]
MDLLALVAVIALVLAVVALVVALLVLRAGQVGRSRPRPDRSLPTDVAGLRAEVQALRVEARDALRHLAVVRYDAFGDMGGHLSWSMALLDDGGNGVVLTSIHGRSDARTYAKNIAEWRCDQALSPEEDEAVKFARAG